MIDTACPSCGEDNRCPRESGEPYRGPCWCEEIPVPVRRLRLLADQSLEPRCLCHTCLSKLTESEPLPSL
jgi:hypothetical protein